MLTINFVSGSLGSQFLSFFPHEGPGLVRLDLFGLNPSDHDVVEVFGVLTKANSETQDGVEADTTQTRRGAAACALGEVLGNSDQGVLGGAQAEQWGVGALGEVRAASGTAQAADALASA